jgi:hydroxyacylglutathione hydrolase
MTPTQIVRIPAAPLNMINAHLVVSGRSAVLVDAGTPGFERAVERALHQRGLDWSCLKLIVVTHAHFDHAGGAAAIQARCGAPVVSHRAELPYLLGEKPMTLCATSWAGRAFYRLPLIHRRYRPVQPQLFVEDGGSLSLEAYGIDGVVRHCAGHTQGALSVELATGEALVGDLVASGVLLGGIARLGRPIRPPFEEDPVRVSQELTHALARGAQRFYLGHGGPLPRAAVERHAEVLRQTKPGIAQPQRLASR